MPLPSQPYDTLFRAIVSDPRLAAPLLEDYLPGSLVALLDRDHPPEHIEGTFIDGDGARTQCDALFHVRLATGEPLHIYVLLEHKSRVDHGTPLQLLGYMLNIWRRDLVSKTGRLAPIIPLVFYHGPQRWRVPLSVPEMIDAPAALEPYVRDFAYVLHDLGERDPEQISRDPALSSALLTLVVLRDPEKLTPELLTTIVRGLVADNHVVRMILHLMSNVQGLTRRAVEDTLRRTQPDRWEVLMGTMAEAWLEEGEARMLLRLMERRFREVPETVRERVTAASSSELDAWEDAFAEATTFEEFMARAPRRH